MTEEIPRVIGRASGKEGGPVVVFFGGVHGNEPAGIMGLQEVFRKIYEQEIGIKGHVYGLRGNIPALAQQVRYIDKDLNRIWFTRLTDQHEDHENILEVRERHAMQEEIFRILERHEGPFYFFDLHTTSSQSVPFLSISDTIRNRELVKDLNVPVILGLEERMEGTIFSFFSEVGIPMVLFEGGQHDEYSSVENIESFIWIMLKRIGSLDPSRVAEFHRYEERIARENVFKHDVFELRYRYDLTGKSDFEMKQGYVNFQDVSKGEEVATQHGKPVTIPFNGRIFMPLYQSRGNDGFFIIRSIRERWLRLSARIRRSGLDEYLHWLPGVKKHPDYAHAYLVNHSIARLKTMQLFHLLGFRKVIRLDKTYLVTRRPFDTKPPDLVEIRKRFKGLMDDQLASSK